MFTGHPETKLKITKPMEQALAREPREEIRVEDKRAKPYTSYTTTNEVKKEQQKVYCFLVDFDGVIVPSEEITKYGWFSTSDHFLK